jgi:hypothetical protein
VSANRELEGRILRRLRVGFRTVVLLNWFSMLVFLFLNGITKDVTTGAFTVFRVTAVCATLWLLVEVAEAITGRTRVSNPIMDALLILPMFGFWYLVWVSSF